MARWHALCALTLAITCPVVAMLSGPDASLPGGEGYLYQSC